MRIFILTYGRSEQQHTYNNLPAQLQQRVTFVIQHREKHLYTGDKYIGKTYVLPKHIERISPTREHLLYTVMKDGGKFVMLDDDLRFDTRRTDDPEKFLAGTDKDILAMFKAIEKTLDKYAHVGILSREGGNRTTAPTKECTRMTRVLAYDASVLLKEKVSFNRLPLQQDFDMTLQLLRKGYKNCVLCAWVHNQNGSNAKGGCSSFRTIDMLNHNARELAALHAPFVKVVEKHTKTAWGGQSRMDVVVQWKQAYQSSQSTKGAK